MKIKQIILQFVIFWNLCGSNETLFWAARPKPLGETGRSFLGKWGGGEYFAGDMVQRLRKEEREGEGKGRWFPKIERF